MNIALSTLIIFFLLLPGLIFRRFYFTEEFSKQYFKSTFFELIISSFAPAILLQFVWMNLCKITNYQVDLRIIGELITSKDYPINAFNNIQNNIAPIIIYNLTMYFFSAFIGHSCKYFIRKRKIDRKRKIFRFQNSWHYIFTGEFFEFPRAAFDLCIDSIEDIEFIYIDALVQLTEGTIIYEGILVDYELSKEGGLDNLSLKEARRRFIKDSGENAVGKTDATTSSNSDKKYYNIPGHILVIPYSNIVNLNFSYYKLCEEPENNYIVRLVN